MGNAIGRGKRKARLMKIDGQTFKLRTPATARDAVKDYPGHVLLESEAVKRFGIRAEPLEPDQELKPGKVYFLIEPPKLPAAREERQQLSITRRVRSGIQISAKDRLECLLLSRRTVSDLSVIRSSPSATDPTSSGSDPGMVRVKMRLPKSRVDQLIRESGDSAEVAEKIVALFMENSVGDERRRQVQCKPELGRIGETSIKPTEKGVSFLQHDEEIQLLPSHYPFLY